MHHSRLCAILIDCKTADVDEAAHFWGEALGRPVDPKHPGSRGNYLMLSSVPVSRKMPTTGTCDDHDLRHQELACHAAASFSPWMSIFFIFIMAPITLPAFGPVIRSGRPL